MSRIVTLIALALATAAVAASVAAADSRDAEPGRLSTRSRSACSSARATPNSRSRPGRSAPARTSRSQPACYGPSKGANLTGAAATVDPLAMSYLIGQGLTPSEVTSWTVGDCSHEVKASSCYAMFKPTVTPPAATIGFSWGDAGIGAAATLGIVLLLGGLGAALISRHNHRPPMARA